MCCNRELSGLIYTPANIPHISPMGQKAKNPSRLDWGFLCISWWVVRDSNLRPTD